jgi:hypothetical protein
LGVACGAASAVVRAQANLLHSRRDCEEVTRRFPTGCN